MYSILLVLHCEHGGVVKRQIAKSHLEEYFSFVDLNERPNLI
jgi:hypothetical protein